MKMADHISVLILTFNEEANIARTLEAVKWARRIVIVDSGSTDNTLDIVQRFPQAVIVTRPFDSFARQCNFGLSQIESDWVLSLDADYELSPDLVFEIGGITPPADVVGYEASFVYRIFGRPLRGALYPRRTVLYQRDAALYRDVGHGHRVMIEGRVVPLRGPIFHDDRKPLSRWLGSQQKYARLEADYLLGASRSDLRISDRIRLAGWPAPLLVFIFVLFIKGCVFDGPVGWLYVLQRTLAETMIALEIVDRRLRAVSLRPPR